MRILVVEDDEILLDGLSVGLALNGFTVDAVSRCDDAEAAIATHGYHAVVLDVMLPDGSGIDLLKSMRRAKNVTPVLLLTALDQVRERISGLNAGADDYVGKPFDLNELSARVRAIARRGIGRAEAALQWRGLKLDPGKMLVELRGEVLHLTRREFSILRALMERPNATVSKTSLEEVLYGWQEEIESNAIEVHIHHLRSKLGRGLIQTIRGVGYRLSTE